MNKAEQRWIVMATRHSTSSTDTVRRFRLASDAPVKILPHPNLVDAVAFDETGTQLATGCHDGILRVWDLVEGREVRAVRLFADRREWNRFARNSLSPSGQLCATFLKTRAMPRRSRSAGPPGSNITEIWLETREARFEPPAAGGRMPAPSLRPIRPACPG